MAADPATAAADSRVPSYGRFPKPCTKPAHNTRLMETRRSDSNPKVRGLIAIGGPFVLLRACNLHLASRVTFENGPISLRARKRFTVIN